MEAILNTIKSLVQATEEELDAFLKQTSQRVYKRQELLSIPGQIPEEIFFINKGIIRVMITDKGGTEHTLHFALEHQFIADYSCFIQQTPSFYTLQAVEETEVLVIPRSAIEWGYENLKQGDRLGRKIAEYYFVYQDNRIKNLYSRTPKERYDSITTVFPNIHNRVPQHMIASYLGITPVHLSRLKKQDN